MSGHVLVAGAGPSGLVVASELALAGVDVTVLERRTEPVQSRAGTVLPRVLELLDARGMVQQFLDRARAIRPNPLFTTHMWAGMRPVHWDHLESRYGYRLILPQNVTEELLTAHALGLGVTIRRGATVTDVAQDGCGVRVTLADEQGTTEVVEGSYLVGCDGGRSTVRRQIGVDFVGHGATFTGIVADVVLEDPWPQGRRIADNDRGWLAALAFGPDTVRFNLVHAERRRADPAEPVTAEEVRTCVSEILEEEVSFREVGWASRFSDATRIASSFGHGRVFLVGESTRVHYPASGVGMNFCIQDAFNLGWKLAAVVNGHAGPDLLSTYESERRPVTEALLRSVAAQCAVQFSFTAEGIAFKRWFESTVMPVPEVDRRLALELNGLTEPYPGPPGSHPMTGQRLPHLELQLPEGIVAVADLLHSQRFLAVDLTGDGRLEGLRYLSAPVDVVTAVPVRRPEALRSATSLLVRPDSYLAWVGQGGDDGPPVRAEIARWMEHAR